MTNYEKYFGSPKKAADTLKRIGEDTGFCIFALDRDRPTGILTCINCQFDSHMKCTLNDLKWLESEVEE